MKKMRSWISLIGVAGCLALAATAAAAAPDSKRMERAKDYIADEQWARAIVELQAVAEDPREANRDEALFWLAQSEHEIALFMEASGLKSANAAGLPSYPARKPRTELDFILHTRGIEIDSFSIPAVTYSDHLPLVCDFRVTGVQRVAA